MHFPLRRVEPVVLHSRPSERGVDVRRTMALIGMSDVSRATREHITREHITREVAS